MLYQTDRYTIYCGDRTDPFFPPHYERFVDRFEVIRKKLHAEKVFFLKQVHGTDSVLVTKKMCEQSPVLNLFESTGDILLTQQSGCAIGVVTADCLPVILYDRRSHALGVVHAGWRGTVARALPMAIGQMKKAFGTRAKDLSVLFGPCAGVCCYEVGPEFIDLVPESVLERRDAKLFFDKSKLNTLQLVAAGVLSKNITIKEFSSCTMCDRSYHSHRREGKGAGRQATVVVLKSD